jgi:hypothetical protein
MKFSFAPKKCAWFFKNYVYYKKGSEKGLDEIRNMYGSTVVNNSGASNDKQEKEVFSLA